MMIIPILVSTKIFNIKYAYYYCSQNITLQPVKIFMILPQSQRWRTLDSIRGFWISCTVGCCPVVCWPVGCWPVGCWPVADWPVGCLAVGCCTVECWAVWCYGWQLLGPAIHYPALYINSQLFIAIQNYIYSTHLLHLVCLIIHWLMNFLAIRILIGPARWLQIDVNIIHERYSFIVTALYKSIHVYSFD